VEIWGWCSDCARWFYCDGWFDRTRDEPTCPVCAGQATKIVNRAAGTVVVDRPQVAGMA
jgi:hypothetical protein